MRKALGLTIHDIPADWKIDQVHVGREFGRAKSRAWFAIAECTMPEGRRRTIQIYAGCSERKAVRLGGEFAVRKGIELVF